MPEPTQAIAQQIPVVRNVVASYTSGDTHCHIHCRTGLSPYALALSHDRTDRGAVRDKGPAFPSTMKTPVYRRAEY